MDMTWLVTLVLAALGLVVASFVACGVSEAVARVSAWLWADSAEERADKCEEWLRNVEDLKPHERPGYAGSLLWEGTRRRAVRSVRKRPAATAAPRRNKAAHTPATPLAQVILPLARAVVESVFKGWSLGFRTADAERNEGPHDEPGEFEAVIGYEIIENEDGHLELIEAPDVVAREDAYEQVRAVHSVELVRRPWSKRNVRRFQRLAADEQRRRFRSPLANREEGC